MKSDVDLKCHYDDEKFRLETIKKFNIARLYENDIFNTITQQLAQYFNAPIVLISLVDKDYQFFLSHYGVDIASTETEVSFCVHALKHEQDYFEITDATQDYRFCNNPLVTGYPFIRSYLGHKLYYNNGAVIGTICIIDNEPRKKIETKALNYLSSIAKLTVQCIELGNAKNDLIEVKKELNQTSNELSEFTYRSSHDFRAPLLSSLAVLQKVKHTLAKNDKMKSLEGIDFVYNSLRNLNKMKENILSFYATDIGIQDTQFINIEDILQQTLKEFESHPSFHDLNIQIKNDLLGIRFYHSDYLPLIFKNIIQNACNFIDRDKEASYLNIHLYAEDNLIFIDFADNGLGIPSECHEDVFKMFKKFHPALNEGGGLGLYLSKKAAKSLNGDIFYESTNKEVTKFTLVLPTVETANDSAKHIVN